MTTAITENKPLCSIHCSNDRIILVEMTPKQLDEKMENAYMILDDWTRLSTARNLIRQYWPASSIEYYEYFIVPSLPDKISSRMKDMLWRLPDDVKKKVSLQALLIKQKEFENEQ